MSRRSTVGAALLVPILMGAPALFPDAPPPGIPLAPGVLDPGDRFGSAVAVGDGVVAVGAYLSRAGSGAVYLFGVDGSLALPPLRGGPGDWFGFDVAIDGACLLVGAPRAPGASGARTGAAYLYDLSVLVPNLAKGDCRLSDAGRRLPIDGRDGDEIGSAVAVGSSSLTWAVGARSDGQAGPGAGIVYVHQDGQVDLKLFPGQPAQGAEFGQSVSLDGNLLAVGAPFAEVAGQPAGMVYLFDRKQPGGWKPSRPLSAPRAGDAFGYSVAASASQDAVVIGAPLDGSRGDDAGTAYLYHRVSGVWQQPGTPLDPPDGARAGAGAQFGVAVAFDRGGAHEIVVGARRAGSHREGAAYRFSSEDLLPEPLISPNPQAGAEFGISAAIHAGTVVIGASLQGGGAAYLFAPIPPQPQKVTVQWEAPSVTVAESAGVVRLPVVVRGLTTGKVTVQVAAVNPTAGSHFQLINHTLTIPAGQSRGVARIRIVQDPLRGDEIFRVALTNPTGAELGTPSEEVITMLDDDPAGLVIRNPPRLVTTDEGGTDHFTVALVSQPDAQVEVNFNGAAGNGQLSPDHLVFTPADWNRPQTVTITGVEDVEDPGCVADTPTRYLISVTTSSGDRRYAALSPPAAPIYQLPAVNRHHDRTEIIVASATVCAYPDGTVFYRLVLTNQGECALEEAAGTSLVERLPWDALSLVTAVADRGSVAVDLVANSVLWSGAIPQRAQATITIVAAQTGALPFSPPPPPALPQGDLTYASRPGGGSPDTFLHLDPSVFIAGPCP